MSRTDRYREYRDFLAGGPATRPFFCLDPSSFAAVYAGKESGHPSLEDQLAFHTDFPSDAGIAIPVDPSAILPELRWQSRHLKTDADGSRYREEWLETPHGRFTRVIADRFGTTPWLVEPAIQSAADFVLADVYAATIAARAPELAQAVADVPARLRARGIQPGAVIYTAFELQYLVDYADMPLLYSDCPERYLAAVENMHAANLALLDALSGIGIEVFYTGSAGLELLSPTIFNQAIMPFQREFNDRVRALGGFVNYHICGHSRQLIEQKIIDRIKPTVFETCSAPPCGNNGDLRQAVFGISEEIITKGNLALETLQTATPAEIRAAVAAIKKAVRGRRHIIGQADATILAGTPPENIRAFIDAANDPDSR